MERDAATRVLRAAGFPDWKAKVDPHPTVEQAHVAALTSPDFAPAPRRGRLVVATGETPEHALQRAIAKARQQHPTVPTATPEDGLESITPEAALEGLHRGTRGRENA